MSPLEKSSGLCSEEGKGLPWEIGFLYFIQALAHSAYFYQVDICSFCFRLFGPYFTTVKSPRPPSSISVVFFPKLFQVSKGRGAQLSKDGGMFNWCEAPGIETRQDSGFRRAFWKKWHFNLYLMDIQEISRERRSVEEGLWQEWVAWTKTQGKVCPASLWKEREAPCGRSRAQEETFQQEVLWRKGLGPDHPGPCHSQ